MSSFTCGSCPSCSETFSSSQVTAVAEARALKPFHWGMLRFLSVYSHFSQNLATLLIVKELFCCLLDLFSLQSDAWIWTLSLQAYQGNILTKGIDLFQCKTFWKPSKKACLVNFAYFCPEHGLTKDSVSLPVHFLKFLFLKCFTLRVLLPSYHI